MLDNGKTTVGRSSGGVQRQVKVEVLDEAEDTFNSDPIRNNSYMMNEDAHHKSILGASISLSEDSNHVQQVPSHHSSSHQTTPPRKPYVPVKNVTSTSSGPIHDLAIHSLFTSPTGLRRSNALRQRERQQVEVKRKILPLFR